jgi:hypothetical protein
MENEGIKTVETSEDQNVTTYIDGYCERNNQPDFLAEPLNFVTNTGNKMFTNDEKDHKIIKHSRVGVMHSGAQKKN